MPGARLHMPSSRALHYVLQCLRGAGGWTLGSAGPADVPTKRRPVADPLPWAFSRGAVENGSLQNLVSLGSRCESCARSPRAARGLHGGGLCGAGAVHCLAPHRRWPLDPSVGPFPPPAIVAHRRRRARLHSACMDWPIRQCVPLDAQALSFVRIPCAVPRGQASWVLCAAQLLRAIGCGAH